MKVRITVDFTVTDENGAPIEDMGTLVTLSREVAEDMRSRLFGAGFLPSDLLVGTYSITPGVVE